MKISHKKTFIILVCILQMTTFLFAQDLEPRAYIRAPVNINVITAGFAYSYGGVVTDPNFPLKDVSAKAGTFLVGYGRTFNLFGLTAQAFTFLPYTKLRASASANGQFQTADRQGIGDMRFRISVLLLGAPARKLKDFVKEKPRTIIGTSVTILTPTGLYYSDKLINVGGGRWAIKPEIALSQPINRWLIDLYAGVWFYTDNNSFYPGKSSVSQNPIASFQLHTSYNFKPNLWAAFDATYYAGGNSTLNNKSQQNALSNTRLGATVVLPTGKRSSLKFAFSKGAFVIAGTNFTTFSTGWTYTWL